MIALVIVTNKSDLNTNNKEGSSELKSEVKTCMTEGCIGRLYLYNHEHKFVQNDWTWFHDKNLSAIVKNPPTLTVKLMVLCSIATPELYKNIFKMYDYRNRPYDSAEHEQICGPLPGFLPGKTGGKCEIIK